MLKSVGLAKSFQLSKTKCAYYVLHGLAPYFLEMLLQDIKAFPSYSILFDESLNHEIQDEQMDVQVGCSLKRDCFS